MKLEIKNYSDLRTILEIGTHNVYLGKERVFVGKGSSFYEVEVRVNRIEPNHKVRKEIEHEFLYVDKGEGAMPWNLTWNFIRDNFHSMKATFYVEVETPAEEASRMRNLLQEEYVKASTEKEKKSIIKQMMRLNRIYAPKSNTCLYNEAKGIFAEANNI